MVRARPSRRASIGSLRDGPASLRLRNCRTDPHRRTARLVSKYRPPLPIIALTSHPEVQRQLLLSWGVQALLTKEFSTSEEIFGEAEKTVVRTRLARKGDRIVIIAGDPKGPSGKTEILKVQTIS